MNKSEKKKKKNSEIKDVNAPPTFIRRAALNKVLEMEIDIVTLLDDSYLANFTESAQCAQFSKEVEHRRSVSHFAPPQDSNNRDGNEAVAAQLYGLIKHAVFNGVDIESTLNKRLLRLSRSQLSTASEYERLLRWQSISGLQMAMLSLKQLHDSRSARDDASFAREIQTLSIDHRAAIKFTTSIINDISTCCQHIVTLLEIMEELLSASIPDRSKNGIIAAFEGFLFKYFKQPSLVGYLADEIKCRLISCLISMAISRSNLDIIFEVLESVLFESEGDIAVRGSIATLPMDLKPCFVRLEQAFQASFCCQKFDLVYIQPGRVFSWGNKSLAVPVPGMTTGPKDHPHLHHPPMMLPLGRSADLCEVPVAIPRLSEAIFVDIQGLQFTAFALDAGGRVYAWGVLLGKPGLVPDLSGKAIVALSGSPSRKETLKECALFLSNSGKVFGSGVLDGVFHSDFPKILPLTVLDSYFITKVAAGEKHALFCSINHELLAIGNNEFGQLGVRECPQNDQLVRIPQFSGIPIKKICCGLSHSLVLTESGQLYSFGKELDSHAFAFKPKLIFPASNVFIIDVDCGADHSICLTSDHEVYTWGFGDHGKLGHGTLEDSKAPHKISPSIFGDNKIVSVVARFASSGCVAESGVVFAWGEISNNVAIATKISLSGSASETKFGKLVFGQSCGYLLTGAPSLVSFDKKEQYSLFTGSFSDHTVFERLARGAPTCRNSCLMLLAWIWKFAGQQNISIPVSPGENNPFSGLDYLQVPYCINVSDKNILRLYYMLQAANRSAVKDASWENSYLVLAFFRIFRVHIERLVVSKVPFAALGISRHDRANVSESKNMATLDLVEVRQFLFEIADRTSIGHLMPEIISILQDEAISLIVFGLDLFYAPGEKLDLMHYAFSNPKSKIALRMLPDLDSSSALLTILPPQYPIYVASGLWRSSWWNVPGSELLSVHIIAKSCLCGAPFRLTLVTTNNSSVLDIKTQIASLHPHLVEDIQILVNCVEVEDSQTLASLGITSFSVLNISHSVDAMSCASRIPACSTAVLVDQFHCQSGNCSSYMNKLSGFFSLLLEQSARHASEAVTLAIGQCLELKLSQVVNEFTLQLPSHVRVLIALQKVIYAWTGRVACRFEDRQHDLVLWSLGQILPQAEHLIKLVCNNVKEIMEDEDDEDDEDDEQHEEKLGLNAKQRVALLKRCKIEHFVRVMSKTYLYSVVPFAIGSAISCVTTNACSSSFWKLIPSLIRLSTDITYIFAAGEEKRAHAEEKLHFENVKQVDNRQSMSIEWACAQCTFINSSKSLVCSLCGGKNPNIQGEKLGGWSCNACTFINDTSSTKCQACDSENPVKAVTEVVNTVEVVETKTGNSMDELPVDWKMFLSKRTGNPYYVNIATGQRTWEKPSAPEIKISHAAPSASQWLSAFGTLATRLAATLLALQITQRPANLEITQELGLVLQTSRANAVREFTKVFIAVDSSIQTELLLALAFWVDTNSPRQLIASWSALGDLAPLVPLDPAPVESALVELLRNVSRVAFAEAKAPPVALQSAAIAVWASFVYRRLPNSLVLHTLLPALGRILQKNIFASVDVKQSIASLSSEELKSHSLMESAAFALLKLVCAQTQSNQHDLRDGILKTLYSELDRAVALTSNETAPSAAAPSDFCVSFWISLPRYKRITLFQRVSSDSPELHALEQHYFPRKFKGAPIVSGTGNGKLSVCVCDVVKNECFRRLPHSSYCIAESKTRIPLNKSTHVAVSLAGPLLQLWIANQLDTERHMTDIQVVANPTLRRAPGVYSTSWYGLTSRSCVWFDSSGSACSFSEYYASQLLVAACILGDSSVLSNRNWRQILQNLLTSDLVGSQMRISILRLFGVLLPTLSPSSLDVQRADSGILGNIFEALKRSLQSKASYSHEAILTLRAMVTASCNTWSEIMNHFFRKILNGDALKRSRPKLSVMALLYVIAGHTLHSGSTFFRKDAAGSMVFSGGSMSSYLVYYTRIAPIFRYITSLLRTEEPRAERIASGVAGGWAAVEDDLTKLLPSLSAVLTELKSVGFGFQQARELLVANTLDLPPPRVELVPNPVIKNNISTDPSVIFAPMYNSSHQQLAYNMNAGHWLDMDFGHPVLILALDIEIKTQPTQYTLLLSPPKLSDPLFQLQQSFDNKAFVTMQTTNLTTRPHIKKILLHQAKPSRYWRVLCERAHNYKGVIIQSMKVRGLNQKCAEDWKAPSFFLASAAHEIEDPAVAARKWSNYVEQYSIPEKQLFGNHERSRANKTRVEEIDLKADCMPMLKNLREILATYGFVSDQGEFPLSELGYLLLCLHKLSGVISRETMDLDQCFGGVKTAANLSFDLNLPLHQSFPVGPGLSTPDSALQPPTLLSTPANFHKSSIFGMDGDNDGSDSKVWAAGTGYGDRNDAAWDEKAHTLLRERKMRGEEILLGELASVLLKAGGPGKTIPVADVVVIERSCLLPLLSQYLIGTSYTEISKNTKIYQVLLLVLTLLAESPSTVHLLLELPHQKQPLCKAASDLRDMAKLVLSTSKSDPGAVELTLPNDIMDASTRVLKAVRLFNGTRQSTLTVNSASSSLANDYVSTLKDHLFQLVSGFSSHYYEKELKSNSVFPKQWLNRVQGEFVDLKNALPLHSDSAVLLRVNERKMSLGKMVIFPAPGTPYARGCFVFDVFFPPGYPNEAPKVHLDTTGRNTFRFNPNLYAEGKVCLSLLGTWPGHPSEMWNSLSTFLQVAVSILSLIFIENPMYNEPGHEQEVKNQNQEISHAYNAKRRNATIRFAMLEQIRNPPKGFEYAVLSHFYIHRSTIRAQVEGWLSDGKSMVLQLGELCWVF